MTREEAIKEWVIPALKDTWNKKMNTKILKALEQEPVLDKMRAEIRKKMKFNSFNEGYVLYDDITEVFDKYKAESNDRYRK